MTIQLERRTRFAFLWIALVPVTLFVVALWLSGRFREELAWVIRSHDTRASIRETVLLVTSAERDLRNYLVTGNESYLRFSDSGAVQAAERIEQLRKLTADNLAHRQNIEDLKSAVDAKLADLRRSRDLRNTRGANAPVDAVEMDRGQALMQRIRDVARSMMDEEERRLLSQSRAEARTSRQAEIIFASAIVITLVLLVWAGRLLKKYAARRDQAERALEQKVREIEALNRDLARRVEERTAELRDRAEGLRLALEAGRMGVWEWNRDSNTVKWSPSLEAIHGIAPGTFGGTFEAYLSDVHPDDRALVEQSVTRSLEQKADHSLEYRIVWPDGSVHWLQGKGRVVLDASGNAAGMTGLCMDITERKHAADRLAQLNADLRRSNESLERSNEDLERFAFVASHDLQEPLRTITTYAQLLARESPGQPESDAATFVYNIVDATKRMRQLLADLLTYSQLGARRDYPVEAVDLNFVLESVKQNLKVAIDESGAVITADRLPTLAASAAHVIPLFQNLIANAIKYRSEQLPRIHISVQETDGQLRFAVTDNGIGIEPEYHERIFEVFKRLHGRKIPGTGVGLAICQRVVERYGGRIWVESQAGQGATFLFTLPDVALHSAAAN
jgi:PAS domain S-box-containing protein